MGYIRHHAIIVTAYHHDIQNIHHVAVTLFHNNKRLVGGDMVSPVIGPLYNNMSSFFIAPDGSKEGWYESDVNDERRKEFINYLNSDECPGYPKWVEVCYSPDDQTASIESHAWVHCEEDADDEI